MRIVSTPVLKTQTDLNSSETKNSQMNWSFPSTSVRTVHNIFHRVICTTNIIQPTHPNLHLAQIGKPHTQKWTTPKIERESIRSTSLLSCRSKLDPLTTTGVLASPVSLLSASYFLCRSASSSCRPSTMFILSSSTFRLRRSLSFWSAWFSSCKSSFSFCNTSTWGGL